MQLGLKQDFSWSVISQFHLILDEEKGLP